MTVTYIKLPLQNALLTVVLDLHFETQIAPPPITYLTRKQNNDAREKDRLALHTIYA